MDKESCNECGSSHVVWASISVFKIKYNDIYIYIYNLSSDREIKQIVNYVKSKRVLYNYWYFIVATCFGFYLDHLKVDFLKLRGIISACYVLWDPIL